MAGAIERSSVVRAGLTVEPLMTTSETAYLKTNLMATTIDQEEDDQTGSYTLAMAASEEETQIVWYMSGNFLSDSDISISGGYNLFVLEGMLEWMMEVSSRIDIADENLMTTTLTLPQTGAMTAYIMLFVPALVMLVVGLLSKRRKA